MKLDTVSAASLLAQLGNPTRLGIVRLLVRAGKRGMAVGDIQRELGVPGSTLSHHLSHLRGVGLIWQERKGTLRHCCVDYDKIDAIVSFLTEECCLGYVGERRSAEQAID